tara:strand:- start:4858 stop:6165 length:1308 start_codon:yes stop_codon:yes gene_type:complete
MSKNNYYNDSVNQGVIPILKIAKVVDNSDSNKAGLLKVRITGVDSKESTKNLIDCVPLLPKFLNVIPKVGELVFVFQSEHKDSSPDASFNTKRFWIGPLISQPTKLSGEPADEANAILPDGYTKLRDPNLEIGAYGGGENDIVLQGRYNTDIIQKDRQIWLRAGKFIEGANNKFNTEDIGYIQLKYGGEKLKRTTETKEVVNYVDPKPETSIIVEMITYNANGPLSNDLPPESFKSPYITKTVLGIKIRNIKTGKEVSNISQEFLGQNSRELAILSAENYIKLNRGSKWIIRSNASDLLNKFPNASNNVAIFSINPVKSTKIVTQNKFIANNDSKTSVVNVVANKINLISHNGEHTFDLTNPKGLITDDEQKEINSQAHPLVYGDKLVEFLELMRNYVNLHVHNYNGLPADPSEVKLDVLRFDLDSILNKNINSN